MRAPRGLQEVSKASPVALWTAPPSEALAAELAHMQIAIRNAVRREPAGEGAAPPSRAAAVHAEAIKFARTGRKSTSVG